MYFSMTSQSRGFLAISASMMTCLILLINLSFKMVAFSGLIFTVTSLICPVVAFFYLLALRNTSVVEQRHILNMSLIALYIFSIGIFLLVNLPAAEYMHNNPAYQIVFEDIPKKFFATTFAFGISFYLPHFIFCREENAEVLSPKKSVIFMVLTGLSFFVINFYFLFSEPNIKDFQRIFIDSLLVCSILLLITAVGFMAFIVPFKREARHFERLPQSVSLYHYLVCVAVAIILICVACEYRLVSLSNNWDVTANCLLFPVALMASTIIGELYGPRANLILVVVLIGVQLFFDGLLMLSVALPSPSFFDLTQFYNYILPRRISTATLALFISFQCNTYLLDRLRHISWLKSRAVRIFIANFCARTLICLVSYSLLFTGIYNYDQMITLALNAWIFKNVLEISMLPFIVWLCNVFEKRLKTEQQSSAALSRQAEISDKAMMNQI